jgi:hypothetical protein
MMPVRSIAYSDAARKSPFVFSNIGAVGFFQL